MKNMTSNLALIVVLQLPFCKTSVHHLCIYTHICSLYTQYLFRKFSEFEFQIQHSKLSTFGHYSKLTQCILPIS